MTPPPDLTTTGEFLWDEVGVAQPGDDQRGWPARILVGAVAKALGPLFDVVRDTDAGPGWSAVLDPDRIVAMLPETVAQRVLRWLGQFAGQTFPDGTTATAMAAQIGTPAAFERGTPSGMAKAAGLTLTGNEYVFLKEREGSPYRVTIVTRTSETPSPAATFNAAKAQKPAGLVLTHVVTNVRTYLEVAAAGGGTYAGAAATYGTYAAARGF
jgi:hypothetical protein